jgi:structural maintenance of chromosomes protein 6
LGDQINFIIGHNGSGKSAILTALTVCLGGKATATNRGSSLKNLIKEGEKCVPLIVNINVSTATIVVKIANGGKDPYKPESYGNIIIVERRFSRDGTSGYKIKSKSGHTISTKREELQDILDHIQLQVDNPMTVLTQDTARQFLGNSSTGEKYKLFMRGVQLQQLDTDYTMIEGQVATLAATLQSKEEALETLKELEREAKNKLNIFERSARLEEDVKKLQNQFAWKQVQEQEKVPPNFEHLINERLSRLIK